MSHGAALRTLVGALLFFAITLFEQLPILGWLGFGLSIGVWVALTRDLRRNGGTVAEAAVLGILTGAVGAISAWLMQVGNLVGLDTAGGARIGAAFGAVGSSLGIVFWPMFGAMVCAVAAGFRGRVRRPGGASPRRNR